MEFEVARLDPLFAYQRSTMRRSPSAMNQYSVAKKDFSTYEGNCFLGIDAGSTTTKAALVGEDGSSALLFLQQQQRQPA